MSFLSSFKRKKMIISFKLCLTGKWNFLFQNLSGVFCILDLPILLSFLITRKRVLGVIWLCAYISEEWADLWFLRSECYSQLCTHITLMLDWNINIELIFLWKYLMFVIYFNVVLASVFLICSSFLRVVHSFVQLILLKHCLVGGFGSVFLVTLALAPFI